MKTNLPLNSKAKLVLYASIIVALFSYNQAYAYTYYAIASGNWNVNTTWSLTSGGVAVPAGVWPIAGDNVFISEDGVAFTVTIPAGYAAACANIYMGAANAVANTLNLAASTSSLSVSGNVIIYGPLGDATRSINADGGTITIGGNLELNNGQNAANGNRICRVSVTAGTVTVGGNLVFNNIASSSNNQAQIVMSAGAGTFNLAGNFNIVNAHGILTAGTTSTFNFNGSAAGQTIPVGVAAIVYNNININNTHANGATLSAAVTATNVTGNIRVQTGKLNNGGFAITLASTKNFSASNNATFNLTGTSTMPTVSGGGTKTLGPASTVNYAGTNQAVSAETYGHIIFSDGGTKTLPISTLTLAGNWTNNSAALNAGMGSVVFQGPTAQTIGGSSSTSFFNLTLDNSAGALLGINTTVSNAMTLTSGILATGAFTLNVSNTATGAISGASALNYINGNVQRGIAAGVNTYEFPTGTDEAYAPVSLAFTAGTEAGSLKCFSTNGDHPIIGTSSFSDAYTVNRYWTFSIVSGLATANYDATFNWADTDEDIPFDYTIAYVERYNSGAWSHSTMGTLLPTSAQITGETGFSDFQVGNGCFDPPTAIITGNAIICAGDVIPIRVDLTGTPNWCYTWSDGSNSGTVTNVTESPSYFIASPTLNKTYTITSVTDAVGCTGTTSGSATVITGPSAYAPALFGCKDEFIEIPITVKSFSGVGAISLTLNYSSAVLEYDNFINNSGLIQYIYAEGSGLTGVVRFSGIVSQANNLPDNSVLLTLRFLYKGGYTALDWDDSGDGTRCEFARGAPDFEPYCDEPDNLYYIAGTVTESDPALVADFEAANLFPPRDTDVQLSDLSSGGTISAWAWSFVPSTVIYTSGNANSQNPVVQFTNGGLYTVTLTVTGTLCDKTLTKTGYIRAGTPGVWDGPNSPDWFTETNWDDQLVPAPHLDVIITTRPSGTHNYPHHPGNLTIGVDCNSITLTGAAELRVDGVLHVAPGKTLQVKDNAKVHAGH